MQVVTHYPDGIFCWVDVVTTDLAGAKAFYSGLFGWEFDDQPSASGAVYAMAKIGGKDVAGIGSMPPDMQTQGIPTHWTSYVKESDVEATAAKVTEAGGTLLLPPMDIESAGRMIMGQDPTGATFGVWQPKAHIGAALVNQPNTLVWNELHTRDLERAKAFYAKVFGWSYQVEENGYVVVKSDGRMQAGMMAIQESWGPVPPNWTVYFMVEDVDAAVAKVQELGGTVMVPPTAAGEMGRFAVIQDPQGGVFSVMEFNGPVDAPPGN